MELLDFVGQPCKTQLAFEFFPKKTVKIDLEKAVDFFKKKGFFVELETRVFVSILIDGSSASVFENGKILVKDTKDRGIAVKIAEKIVEVLNGLA